MLKIKLNQYRVKELAVEKYKDLKVFYELLGVTPATICRRFQKGWRIADAEYTAKLLSCHMIKIIDNDYIEAYYKHVGRTLADRQEK